MCSFFVVVLVWGWFFSYSYKNEVNKKQTNGWFNSLHPCLLLSLGQWFVQDSGRTGTNSKGESVGNSPCNSHNMWRCQSCASGGGICLMPIFPRHPLLSLVVPSADYPSVSTNLLFNWPVLHLPHPGSPASEALAKGGRWISGGISFNAFQEGPAQQQLMFKRQE